MKKSIKLLTLMFAATTAITLPVTLLATSCTTYTNNKSNSNIVINSQSSSTNNYTIGGSETLELFVDASTNSGTLIYAWSISKDNGSTWETISGATSSKYNVANTPGLDSITTTTTWRYKVKVSLSEATEGTFVEGSVYSVKFTPASSSSEF